MTLTIDISSETQSRLKNEAARLGIDEAEYARRLIEQSLPRAKTPPAIDQATLDLFARWDVEDQTDDPAEIARRKKQWEEFRDSMNEHSLSSRKVYP